MPMTYSIYDAELYANSFLFTPEEFSKTKSKDKLPIKCSHCGKTFYRKKKDILDIIRLHKTNMFCSMPCVYKHNTKQTEHKIYTCKFCSKIFTKLPSKYANGDFCSKECARKYASKFANTEIKRLEKSNTVRNNLNIPKINSLDERNSKSVYYIQCRFTFGFSLPQIQGYELYKKYGTFSKENPNGVSRDHMISRYYGWTHKIPPEIIRHPANCRIMKQSDNYKKYTSCSITLEQLYERIDLWNKGLPLPEVL